MKAVRLFFALFLCAGAFGKENLERAIDALHPTQFTAGYAEVKIRRGKIREEREDGTLRQWKKDHPVEAVFGPGGKLYVVDGHHEVLALSAEGERTLFVTVEKDWQNLSEEEFWEKMATHRWVYLRDQHDHARKIEELPRHVTDLADDAHRSLAWMVRKAGAYDKSDEAFAEFAWAGYLRPRVSLAGVDTVADWKRAVRAACAAALSTGARNLPGYLGSQGSCDVSEVDWDELERKSP